MPIRRSFIMALFAVLSASAFAGPHAGQESFTAQAKHEALPDQTIPASPEVHAARGDSFFQAKKEIPKAQVIVEEDEEM
eukprot:CAMPEP_0172868392 /NCGR_PEP_ID=MMETSP1075-20121228/86192_1 /TAXON_ID=2916 /ORGANISM="Ceratium fusus, Strain PA161109" /LENGTH=78 /DNA_ID=CAMNT_0013717999 /DNA_START=55 /DNA_END=291 /DNA_ORIENTATION=+